MATSCGDSTGPPNRPIPAALRILAGNSQTGTVGQELPDPLVARVEDEQGNPIEGQLVNFVVAAGGGSVFAGAAQTNADGEARDRWTLGTVAGDTQRVEVRAVDNETGAKLVFATFEAVGAAADPDSIAVFGGGGQQGPVATSLPDSLAVVLFDQYGNPVPDLTVEWSTSAGDAFVEPTSSVTDSAGIARTSWTLGTQTGTQQARAAVDSFEVHLQATATSGPVATIELDPDSLHFTALGGSRSLDIDVRDAHGNEIVGADTNWSSSDSAVATIADGTIRPRSNGKAWISVDVGGIADTAVVTVEQVIVSIEVQPARDSIFVDDSLDYSLVALDSSNVSISDPEVVWETTDSSIAVIDVDGVVTALSRGHVTVIARGGNAADSSSLEVLRRDSIPPVLTVSSPGHADVTRDEIRIAAVCTDDDPLGCESLVAVTASGETLAAGETSLDTVVSLAAFDGQFARITLTGRDPFHATTVQLRVAVESSPALLAVATVDGAILDADTTRILHFDSTLTTGRAKIRDRSSGVDVSFLDTGYVEEGYLTPRGALFRVPERATYVFPAPLYEWRDGSLINRGDKRGLRVAGNYAIWSDGDLHILTRYDIGAGTVTPISDYAATVGNDVAENGDVVFKHYSVDDLYRYRNGSTTAIASDAASNMFPETDGTSVLYRRDAVDIMLLTDSAVVALSVGGAGVSSTDDYEIQNGWIAFTRRSGAGIREIWSRSQAGTEERVTSFASDSRIEGMGPDGDIILVNGSRRYYWSPVTGGSPVEIGSALGAPIWIDSDPHVVIGNTLFEVQPQ